MSLVRQVIDSVRASGGVVSLPELSKELGVQPAALHGILQFCAQKGYLKLDFSSQDGCQACKVSGCGTCSIKPPT